MRLRSNQLSHIHRSFFCCGRKAISRRKQGRQTGIYCIDYPLHTRGYGEIRSNEEMRKLLDKKIVSQKGESAICKVRFTDYTALCPTTSIPAEWEERGETIILKTFRQSAGGAMGKRDRAEVDLWPECCLSYSTIKQVPEVGESHPYHVKTTKSPTSLLRIYPVNEPYTTAMSTFAEKLCTGRQHHVRIAVLSSRSAGWHA